MKSTALLAAFAAADASLKALLAEAQTAIDQHQKEFDVALAPVMPPKGDKTHGRLLAAFMHPGDGHGPVMFWFRSYNVAWMPDAPPVQLNTGQDVAAPFNPTVAKAAYEAWKARQQAIDMVIRVGRVLEELHREAYPRA